MENTKQVILDRLIRQEARLRMLEEELEAHELVLAWMLRQMPQETVEPFLALQANAFDQTEWRDRFPGAIAVLDHLRALVAACSAPSVAPPSAPQG